MPPYTKPVSEGLVLTVRLTPNAARDEITGVDRRTGAAPALQARVKAVPEKGKANAALTVLLAQHLGLPKRTVEVISGHTARTKRVLLHGEPAALEGRLRRLLKDRKG